MDKLLLSARSGLAGNGYFHVFREICRFYNAV